VYLFWVSVGIEALIVEDTILGYEHLCIWESRSGERPETTIEDIDMPTDKSAVCRQLNTGIPSVDVDLRIIVEHPYVGIVPVMYCIAIRQFLE
jgi:hypothetical protein